LFTALFCLLPFLFVIVCTYIEPYAGNILAFMAVKPKVSYF
jgi:hypothetical protein